MSNSAQSFRRPEVAPNIRQAGVSTLSTDSVSSCFQMPTSEQAGPGTPPHLKKYRKSHQNQPGIKQIHPGVFDDKLKVGENHSFGNKLAGSDHVTDVIQSQNLAGLAARFNDIKELNYASNLREPLAKGFERHYEWPQEVNKGYVFGVPTVSSYSTKELVNPDHPLENAPEVQAMYKKTHGNFGPGE